jgi:Ni/Co efflux regulator RcnB
MKQLTILALIVALASPALALDQKDKKHATGKGKSKGKEDEQDKGNEQGKGKVAVVFVDADRQTAHAYFEKQYGRGNCPPGLAKKNNGCLPPGQAKKRYVVGQPLPREVAFIEPPHELVVSLRPCPPGYKYVMVDGDLVKLAVGTMLVVDAIDGLLH